MRKSRALLEAVRAESSGGGGVLDPTWEVNYTSDNCGEHSKPGRGIAHAPGELTPPYNIKINGSSDLHDCIKWNSSGKVYTLHVRTYPLGYIVYADAEGPHGFLEGCGYLRFIDYTGDHYDLSVCSRFRRTHWVEYMSARPGIKTVEWRNQSF